jgi:hypothetical protein
MTQESQQLDRDIPIQPHPYQLERALPMWKLLWSVASRFTDLALRCHVVRTGIKLQELLSPSVLQLRVIWYKLADISDEFAASIFRMKE